MLEGLAAWVLNTYIGEYLENLNTDQLSIGLLQGFAELENVPLKRTALRKFDVPLCVRAGVIGKLTLSVPLTHLRSEPWVVTVNDLYVVLEPNHHHYDMEFEAQYNQEKKKMQLDALEIMHKKRLADSGSIGMDTSPIDAPRPPPPSGSGWWAYGASFVSTIVENIQLIATNVHIRYEDNTTIPGHSFACGVKIGRFSVQSADPSWTPRFVLRREGETRRKLVELKECSLYWDGDGGHHGVDAFKLMAPENHKDLMQKMKESEVETIRHDYLLSPLGLRVKMEKNTSTIPLKNLSTPRFKFDLETDRMNLQGGRRQFTELRLMIDEWHRYERGKPYRKWRPKAALTKETVRQWWKYAIVCHLETIRQRNERRTWKYVCSRAHQVTAYCRAYIRMLSGRGKEFTKMDEILMRQIEREYGFDELQLLREGALRYGLRTGKLGNPSTTVATIPSLPHPQSATNLASESSNYTSAVSELSTSHSSASLSTTTPVHTPKDEEDEQQQLEQNRHQPQQATGYLAGWLGYWWPGSSTTKPQSTQLLYDPPPIMEPLRDDPALKEEIEKVEQVLEEELWDMYNETMDDSAVMGRDLLFASVNFSMKSLNIAFAGGISTNNGGPSLLEKEAVAHHEMHECLSEASLEFGLRMKYLPVPESRQVVIPCFEISAKFSSGLNLCFTNKQYESVLRALAGWSGKAADENRGGRDDNDGGKEENVHRRYPQTPDRSRKTSLDQQPASMATSRRSSSVVGKIAAGTSSSATSRQKRERKDRADFQLIADVEIPKLRIDLKTDFNADAAMLAESGGQPLVSIMCETIAVAYRKTKPHICSVETSMSSFVIVDLLEGATRTPNLPHLVKASGTVVEHPSNKERSLQSFLSTSCPDVYSVGNIAEESPIDTLLLSSSLPSAVSPPPIVPPALRHFFPSTPPSTPITTSSHHHHRYESTSSRNRRRSEHVVVEEKEKRPRSASPSRNPTAIPITTTNDESAKRRTRRRIRTESSTKSQNPCPVRVLVTIVDTVHEGFYDSYKQVGTLINLESGDLELVINEQTLILVLDFLGFLTPADGTNDESLNQRGGGGMKTQLEAEIRSLKVVMNKPTDGFQLGNILMQDLQASILIDEIGFSLNGQTHSVALNDETPIYSRLYSERLNFVADGEKSLQFLFYKYNQSDRELKREFDAFLAIYGEDGVHYVHTQRYLAEVIQFWTHFAQVYDLYSNSKAVSLGFPSPEGISHGFRLKLRVDVRSASLILPTSSLDDSVLVVEASRLVAENDFLFSSLLEEGRQSTSQDDYDCLVDVLQLHLADVRLFEGVRLVDDHDRHYQTESAGLLFAENRRAIEFRNYTILTDTRNLLNRSIPLDITLARNLDTYLARNVPDIKIHTSVNSVSLKLHVDTYATIRAMLDYNLGEELPSTANSFGQVATPRDTNAPWTALELTCDLNDIVADCYVPESFLDSTCSTSTASGGWNPSSKSNSESPPRQLSKIEFERVKFSLEIFSDGARHVDLICNDARLIDTRFDALAANKRENVFSTIWSSASDETGDSKRNDKLLGEVHFATEKNCSTLTLVFSRARLIYVEEWLLLAQNFLMTEAPTRKVKDFVKSIGTSDVLYEKKELDKWKSQRGESLAKTRVVTRAELEDMKKDNFKLKATLLESEVIFLERPSSRNSLAIILKATASLYFENMDNCMRFECRDSNLQLFDCVYGNKEETSTALTNSFLCTAELSAVPKTARTSKYVNLGLLETVPQMHEYRLKMSLANLIAKLSYRDYLVLRAVWEAYAEKWAEPMVTTMTTMIEESTRSKKKISIGGTRTQEENVGTVLEKIELKLESVSVCLLDDYQDTRFPLFKIGINDGMIEHRPGKSKHEPREGCGAVVLEMSYFNQKVYGWEPFMEAWRVDNLSWSYNPLVNSLNLEILGDKLLDLTITKTFIQQTRHFLQYWPSLSENLSKDFRSGFTKRSDILPYLLVNETGSVLSFSTCLGGQKRSGGGTPSGGPGRWINVNDGETRQFSFETDPWHPIETDSTDPFLSHHIVIQVDGWMEISPIPVDAVGTFFRLARLDASKKSSLSHAVSYTRLVAAVSIDQDGRKVVTARSALMFVNGLMDPLTVRLEVTGFVGEHTEFVLPPGAVRPAPLAYANSKIFVRPIVGASSWSYCKAINWGHVNQKEQAANYVRTCTSMEAVKYRMCVSVKAESYPEIHVDGGVVPGHTLSFVPPLIVNNLLPLDLHVNVGAPEFRRTVAAGQWSPFVEIDPVETIELKFETEYFHSRQSFYIYATAFQEQKHDLEMIDHARRPLILQAKLTPIKGGAVKVTISAPFWFINKSGLPLIIKQEAADEAAGQFDEHEHARSMTPVMFSFAESGAPLKCSLRLGKLVHPDCVSDWCRSFVLEPGITFKELRSIPTADRRPARVYNIGVEVRPGQGMYKETQVVLLTARYLIDNRSRYKLHISQLYDAERQATGQYTVAPNCSLAWHWPRQDLDLLLCVRRDDLPYWSSPFRIDQLKSFHLTFRDSQFMPQFLRLEIILRGAVYYVTFSSAENIPAPIRIENSTDAPVLFNQKSCDASHLRAVLRPHSQVNYSFDDAQFKPPIIMLTAQNGKTIEYDLTVLGQGEPLLYENFIYIAFAKTLEESPKRLHDELDLVLDVLQQGKVILNRKDSHRPQQLWRMRSDGHLVNAADWTHLSRHPSEEGAAFVLDVLPTRVEQNSSIPLMLRRLDANRNTTQRWRFTEDNRLVCLLNDMYVQAERAQLKSGTAAILGPTTNSQSIVGGGVPLEQLIVRQRQRPGSGRLAVTVLLDGPTRVLRVTDMADQHRRPYSLAPSKSKSNLEQGLIGEDENQQGSSSNMVGMDSSSVPAMELACCCTLNAGMGLSVVNNDLEELIYCRLTGLIMNSRRERGKYTFGVKVLEIQADNQLWNAERWTLLHIRSKFDEKQDPTFLALDLLVQWTPLPSYDSFDTFIVSINKVALYVDEILLWKLLLFFAEDELSFLNRNGIERQTARRLLNESIGDIPSTASKSSEAIAIKLYEHSPTPNMDLDRPDPKQARRCYFGILNLTCRRLYLSVVTANVLPPKVRQIKQMYSMPLIRFENASVEITPFQQSYYFETLNFLLEALQRHFTQELRSQAVKILGTVDFLGNPVGLFRDVSDSLQELIISVNVSGFVTGIMHGFSNSAAKITSSLSNQVGKMAMDDGHRQLRESVRQSQSQDAMGHLLTGVKSLGIGVVGGVTSVFTQPVDGMKRDGVEGLFTGMVKGMVGMVAKPVQGVLDLATGVSNATREAVSGSDGPLKSRFTPSRLRFPRVARNLRGTLPAYSEQLAMAQKTLLTISEGNLRELCLGMDHCCTLQQQSPVLVLISTTNVYFIRRRRPDDIRVLLNIAYSQLQGCTCVVESSSTGGGSGEHSALSITWQQQAYLKFVLKTTDPQNSKRQIKCDSVEKATELCQKILYAKQQYEEQEQSLAIPEYYGLDHV